MESVVMRRMPHLSNADSELTSAVGRAAPCRVRTSCPPLARIRGRSFRARRIGRLARAKTRFALRIAPVFSNLRDLQWLEIAHEAVFHREQRRSGAVGNADLGIDVLDVI